MKSISPLLLVLGIFAMSEKCVGALVGGTSGMNADDAGVIEAANHAVAQLNADHSAFPGLLSSKNLATPLTLVHIESVTGQVVAGMMYTITMKVASPTQNEATMTVKVWVRPWLKEEGFMLQSTT